MKTVLYTKDKTKVVEGLNKSANVVCSTMGGQGKTVLISQGGINRFTKDGVGVAKSISFEDIEENIGAKMVISTASKTVDMVGDGTTLTTKLLQSFVNKIIKNPEQYTNDLNKTFRLLKDGSEIIINTLRENSVKVTEQKDIEKIATTSSNSKEIGKLFADIFKETGDLDTKISLEKSEYSNKTYFDITKGLLFDSGDSGYADPAFMTNKDTEQAIYENPYVHVTTEPILSLTPELESLMNTSMTEEIPLVIIAPRFSDQFKRLAIMNKTNQKASFLLLRLPGHANGMEKNADDIRAFLDEDGCVQKIVADPVEYTLFNENTPFLEERVTQLKGLIEHSIDKYEAKDMQDRIYKLRGTAAIIYAGGITPEALNEEYDRIEDAVGSVKTAIFGGYSIGAGLALYNIWEKKLILNNKNSHIDLLEENPLRELDSIFEAIAQPALQILDNANVKDGFVGRKSSKEGYNVKHPDRGFVDLVKEGIVDSTEVIVQALQNAISTTILFINSSYILHNESPESDNKTFKF